MPYRVLISRPLSEGLSRRYAGYPLRELIVALRDRLSREARHGKQAPFPFMSGTLTQSFEVPTASGTLGCWSLRGSTKLEEVGADHFDNINHRAIANRLARRLRELVYEVRIRSRGQGSCPCSARALPLRGVSQGCPVSEASD